MSSQKKLQSTRCGCSGKIVHFLRQYFLKPTVVIECSAHGRGCNIGRRKTINLTKTTTLEYKSVEYQVSAAAAKLFGASFLSGLSVSGFCKTVRRSGAKISEAKILSIVQAYRAAIELEY